MYTIVIPVDTNVERGERATRHVIELIENGPMTDVDAISVTVLNVFSEFKAVDDGGNVKSSDLYDEESYPEAVDLARELLDGAGITYDLERRHGDPADEIIEYVDDIEADLVVIAPRKRSAVGKAMFGSVAQDVILSTERPTLIV
jgi:nucleotide-binding universal stress UspA family protein